MGGNAAAGFRFTPAVAEPVTADVTSILVNEPAGGASEAFSRRFELDWEDLSATTGPETNVKGSIGKGVSKGKEVEQ